MQESHPETGRPADFAEDPGPPSGAEALSDDAFVLRLDVYEGPIDVLLDQARSQKVDLTQVSILQLADQYLAFIERARRLRLELAADYLVMAAWLAYLKSRLLLPVPSDDAEPTGAELAAALAFQLRRLESMRDAGIRLMARPRLGIDVHVRGAPEPLQTVRRPVYSASLYDLLRAYADQTRRKQVAETTLRVEPSRLYSTDDALARLRRLLGHAPDWLPLVALLPEVSGQPLVRRSALAATFAASLELARDGVLEIRQELTYGPILLRRAAGDAVTSSQATGSRNGVEG